MALAVDSAHGGDFRAARAKVVADKTSLLAWSASPATANANAAEAEQALALGREIGDAGLVIRALIALCAISANRGDVASPYFAEAAELARAEGDSWRLSQTLSRQALAAMIVGDPIGAVLAAEEGREVANAIGDRFDSRHYRWIIGCTQIFQGDLAGATEQIREVIAEASAANDVIYQVNGRIAEALALAYQGDGQGARIAADKALEGASRLLESFEGACRSSRMVAFLATGDTAAAWEASEAARADPQQYGINIIWSVQAALAYGELKVARRYAHDAVADSMGWWLPWALVGRARVELADGNPEKAESDAHEALGRSVRHRRAPGRPRGPGVPGRLGVPNSAVSERRHGSSVRRPPRRRRMGFVRFKILDAGYDELVAKLRDTLGDKDFDVAFAEGDALSIEEAIAYAQRGRGERKRPASGWASLTPTELDVVRLVGEGLPNKDIAAQLFISAAHCGVASHPRLPQGGTLLPRAARAGSFTLASTPALVKKAAASVRKVRDFHGVSSYRRARSR